MTKITANPTPSQYKALLSSIYEGNPSEVALLLANVPFDLNDPRFSVEKDSPLMWSLFAGSAAASRKVRASHEEVARLLVVAGVNVDKPKVLAAALLCNNPSLLEEIICAGLKVPGNHLYSSSEMPALHLAVMCRASVPCTAVLLRHGADKDATDSYGRTADELRRLMGQYNAAEIKKIADEACDAALCDTKGETS